MTKQKWIIALAVTFYGVATSAGATNLVNLNGNSAEGTPFGYVASGITIEIVQKTAIVVILITLMKFIICANNKFILD